MTVSEYFTLRSTDEDEYRLVEFEGDTPNQFLGLHRFEDGRIDLIDLGCSDTGSDISDSTVDELRQMAREWLTCILGSCSAEEREEIEAEALPQIEAI
jgi:hypothetical protein